MLRTVCSSLVALLLGLTSLAQAGSLTVGGFDGGRVYRPFSGSEYDNLRGRLSDPANFGPGGLAHHTISFAPDTASITAGYLASIDLFVMTEVMGSLSAAESQALADFVLAGGCLAIITDTLHVSMPAGHDGTLAGNAVLGLLGGGSIASTDTVGQGGLQGAQTANAASVLNVASSAVLDGPFGTLTAGQTFGGSWHNALTAGPHSRLLGSRAGSGILMEIPHGVVAPGSGGVLVAGDFIFSDSFVPPGVLSLQNERNATMFLNFVASCDCGCPVPEPATLVLAGCGLVAVLALGRRRRGAAA